MRRPSRVGRASTACLLLFATVGSLRACTGLRLVAADGGVVVGRTMEFGFDIESDALVIPAGTELSSSLVDPSRGMRYAARHGVVGANALGKRVVVDGLNGAGLYVGAFYFPGYARYAEPPEDDAGRALAPEDYATWLLASFGSVGEVEAGYDRVTLAPNPISEIGGESFPGHFVVHDRAGRCVVIEPIEGGLRLHDNPLGVITNSPTFDWHVTNLRNYLNLTVTNVPPVELDGLRLAAFGQGSGLRGLPGDSTPPSRFVRAVAYSQGARKLPTARQTVPQVFHLMNAFDIPVGSVRETQGGVSHSDYTLWTSVADLQNGSWCFRTYDDQTIRKIDVRDALDAAGSTPRVIEMQSEQPFVDVSTAFE